jgi:hypothetical protein
MKRNLLWSLITSFVSSTISAVMLEHVSVAPGYVVAIASFAAVSLVAILSIVSSK